MVVWKGTCSNNRFKLSMYGLESKIKEQIDENEWGLILSAPKEVEEKSRKMDLNTIK